MQSNTSVGRPPKVPLPEELPPLIARSPLAIVDEALRFLRIRPSMTLGITAVVLLPLQLIVLGLPGSSLRGNRPDRVADIIIARLDQPGAVGNAIGTLVFESLALFTVATIYGQLAASWYSGESVSPEDLLIESIKRSLKIVAAWTLTHMALLFAGGISLGFLMLALGPFFIAVAPAMGAENLGPVESIKRSMSLCGNRFVSAVVLYVSVAVAGQVIDASIRFAPTFVLQQADIPVWITNGVFDVIGSIVVQSFTAATAVVFYLDLRVRREGIDLTMAISQKFAPSSRQVPRG